MQLNSWIHNKLKKVWRLQTDIWQDGYRKRFLSLLDRVLPLQDSKNKKWLKKIKSGYSHCIGELLPSWIDWLKRQCYRYQGSEKIHFYQILETILLHRPNKRNDIHKCLLILREPKQERPASIPFPYFSDRGLWRVSRILYGRGQSTQFYRILSVSIPWTGFTVFLYFGKICFEIRDQYIEEVNLQVREKRIRKELITETNNFIFIFIFVISLLLCS